MRYQECSTWNRPDERRGRKKGALPAGRRGPAAGGSREAGIEAPKGAVEGLAAHAAEMHRWNRSIRLTAIVDPVEVAVKHIVDSLALLRFARFPAAARFRLRSGYPGIPLALYLPGTRVVLLEASERSAPSSPGPRDACPGERAGRPWESLGSGTLPIGRFDDIVTRATSRPDEAVRSFRRTLPDGGRMLFMAGPGGIPAAEVPGTVTRVERFRLPRGMGEREIVEVSLPEKIDADGCFYSFSLSASPSTWYKKSLRFHYNRKAAFGRKFPCSNPGHRQPERRRRQDDDRHQPGRLALRHGKEDAPGRPRPAGQRHVRRGGEAPGGRRTERVPGPDGGDLRGRGDPGDRAPVPHLLPASYDLIGAEIELVTMERRAPPRRGARDGGIGIPGHRHRQPPLSRPADGQRLCAADP